MLLLEENTRWFGMCDVTVGKCMDSSMYVRNLMNVCLYWDTYTAVINMTVQRQRAAFFFFFTSNLRSGSHRNAVQHFVSSFIEVK